ncbi:MAG: hypothetical protein P8Z81_12525, partial [Deinococcales bacterium]
MSHVAAVAVLALTLAGGCFWLAAWLLAESFFRAGAQRRAADFAPGVSVLKPLRGLDAEALRNFESFCVQDYPAEYEILFAVSDPADPAAAIVERVQARHPE